MKKKSTRVSLQDIARAAGISKSTVGYVLRNQAGPSEETRQLVLQTAKKLGYVPDARINSWLATVRGAKSKDLLPIAWLNTNPEKEAWHKFKFLSPYLEGVQDRCRELGYRVEEIWTQQPGMTMRRISQILYQRGIEGVIVTPPATHIRLNWNNLAGIALGTELLGPRLHRVKSDIVFNLLLALKMVKRFGYRRVGVCLGDDIDRSSNRVISALASHLAASAQQVKPVPPLFFIYGDESGLKKQIFAWIRSHKPDVIIGHDNHLVKWLEEEGYRVPQKIGVVHLAIDNDVLDWSGIYSQKKEIGRTAAELAVALVRNRQFGMPEVALDTIIRGAWRNGKTLLVPSLMQ